MAGLNPLSNSTALIVDIDSSYRKTLASIIKQHFKFREVYTCSSAREALAVSRQIDKLDFAFCDSSLTDLSVLSLVDELKGYKATSDAKIILLSSQSKREFLLEAASKGVNSFILKPFTPKTITEKIRHLVNGKSQRKAKRIKLFNTAKAAVAFKNAKYNGEMEDMSEGGCMVVMPSLAEGGTIYDQVAMRISYEDNSVDLKAELIRLERDTSSSTQKVKAAFIFKEMNETTRKAFENLWSVLDKSKQ